MPLSACTCPTHSAVSANACSVAKIGAVATAFLFPILLVDLGTSLLLYLLAATSVLGAAITWRFRIETLGVRLDRIGVDRRP